MLSIAAVSYTPPEPILYSRNLPPQEFGLTALHYATWNGHVRCVEVLCINDLGRDEAGLQRRCIDLQSCKGFTSLHLAAADGVDGKLDFITGDTICSERQR